MSVELTNYLNYQKEIKDFIAHSFNKHRQLLEGEAYANFYKNKQNHQWSTLFINHRSIICKILLSEGYSIPEKLNLARFAKSLLQFAAMDYLEPQDKNEFVKNSKQYFKDDINALSKIDQYLKSKNEQTLTEYVLSIQYPKENVMVDTVINGDDLSTRLTAQQFINNKWPEWLLANLETTLNANHTLFKDLYEAMYKKNAIQISLVIDNIILNSSCSTNRNTGVNNIFRAFILMCAEQHNEHNKKLHNPKINDWLKDTISFITMNNLVLLGQVDAEEKNYNKPTTQQKAYELISNKFKSTLNILLTEEEPTMSYQKPKLFELVPTVNGAPASSLSDDQLFEVARNFENEIALADAQKTKPEKLKTKIEDMKTQLKELIAYIDSRD